MTLGKIGARKMMGKPSGGWVKPADWPDIEAILEADVTPQAAIDAGATKKWIMLCNPGPPTGSQATYTVNRDIHVYIKMSDGVTTTEISRPASGNTEVTPLDDGRLFWLIGYTTDDQNVSLPGPVNAAASGILWFYAPYHTFLRSASGLSQQICMQKLTVKDWSQNVTSTDLYNNPMLKEIETITPHAPMFLAGALHQRQNALEMLDSTNWNTSAVTNMSNAYNPCWNLKRLDTSKWNTSAVTSMSTMFSNCMHLASLDVSGWDTSKVTTMSSMFNNCYSLASLDVSGWVTSSVTSMSNVFNNCYSLASLDVSGWDTSSVTSMSNMFAGCNQIKSLDVSKWDVSKVVDSMYYMFGNCLRLESIDISGWNVSGCVGFGNMFVSCGHLTTIIGGKTVAADGSIGGSTAYFGIGPRLDFAVNYSPLLGHDSLLFLMYWLSDLNSLGLSGKTLTLGTTNKAKLSDAEQAIAQNKGWTLA